MNKRRFASLALALLPLAPPSLAAGGGYDFCPALAPVVPSEETAYGPSPERLARYRLSGTASYYSDFFEGRKTANGEIFRQDELTAAHRTLPFGTLLEVRSRATGKSVRLRINDRGPFSGGFTIDLSRSAARAIGVDKTRDRHVEMLVIYLP
ncbi:MAG: septal ring lytic transglycosylase RlpA family protein [Thermoanaerobaculia bacterium]